MGGNGPTRDVDVERLRTERPARLQASMRAHDLEACLLFSEPNTRYATRHRLHAAVVDEHFSAGLEEEPERVPPRDEQPNPDRMIREDMALVVELYLGEVGAREGVKLGDQILVTADGVEVLAPFPWEDALLA
jgi:Xaa-Pro aminopeptidase